MDRTPESGLEVKPSTSPEVAPQPDKNKYYVGGGAPSHSISDQLNLPNKRQAKSQGQLGAFWILAVIAVVCLAVGLGAGIGAGLAAQRKSSFSSGAAIPSTKTGNVTITTPQASDTRVTVVRASHATDSITESREESSNVTTISATPATLPSPTCPAANGSTYTATNKPFPTIAPQLLLQIVQISLTFEILCYTNFIEESESPVLDLQIITNVSTLNDCLDACALYNFQTRLNHFPAYACTGIGWGTEAWFQQAGDEWPVCRLKNNVTLASPNGTAKYPGYDGAVLLNV